MFIQRELSKKLKEASKQFPVVAVVGPRQSGKTTLVKENFSAYQYVSLEDLDARNFANSDPRGFLRTYSGKVIFDEAQRAPHLFSYIQGIVDQEKKAGQFILTGSQNFLVHEGVSQSLAGRVAILTLMPFSLNELAEGGFRLHDYPYYLYHGFYPRVYEVRINPRDWYLNYVQTYIERDVRLIKNITDLNAFQRFVSLCAGRIGQLLNLSSLAQDCGITHNTARAWLSVLEASFIVFLLHPHYKNFNKRIVKMPKLYFYDTGLASALLGIETVEQIATHHLRGSLFESLVISEFVKSRLNRGEKPAFYFWRDKLGYEIDCVFEEREQMRAVEVKSGATITDDYFSNLTFWKKLTVASPKDLFIVYGGDKNQSRSIARVVSWKNISDVLPSWH